jgi:hypothetical protein
VTDYNPGISPERVFWTRPIPDSSLEISEDEVVVRVTDLPVPNYFNYANALLNTLDPPPDPPPFPPVPPVPALVSFEVRWSGVTRRVTVRDTKNHFAGEFFESGATCEWESLDETGFRFRSDPAHKSINLFGVERNGIFFP